MSKGWADDYIDVPSRQKLFYKRHPEGSLRLIEGPHFVTIGNVQWVWAQAAAYRYPTDPAPGVGTAWESIPGRTPYTKGSELMNLETSCWGRAIGALGIGTVKSVATKEELQAAIVDERRKLRDQARQVSAEVYAEADARAADPQLEAKRQETLAVHEQNAWVHNPDEPRATVMDSAPGDATEAVDVDHSPEMTATRKRVGQALRAAGHETTTDMCKYASSVLGRKVQGRKGLAELTADDFAAIETALDGGTE